jgi:7-carboxy-7-deazaguanine synthase
MLKICEIFRSCQFEGIEIGLPTIFIRFSGCNLACTWCDTTYASRPENKFEELSVEEVIKRVESYPPTAGVTFTGGEPFIQDIEELDKLIYELKGRGYLINIETNGLFLPYNWVKDGNLKNSEKVDRYSISPKLTSSGNKNGVNLTTLKTYLQTFKEMNKIFLKFVISNEVDFIEMLDTLEILEKEEGLNNIPIVIQPNINYKIAESIEEQNKKFKELLDLMMMGNYAKKVKFFNIRIIPQFHKYLWANKRAV